MLLTEVEENMMKNNEAIIFFNNIGNINLDFSGHFYGYTFYEKLVF